MPKFQYLSASMFPDMMKSNRTRDGLGQAALDVVYKHASELLGAQETEEITPTSCVWGNENEPNARYIYSQRTLSEVVVPDWQQAPDLDYVGGEMDGLVGSKGGIEIKCPFTFARHLKQDELVKYYWYQIHGYMWIYELDWIELVNYDPRYPSPVDMLITRIERSDTIIKSIRDRCIEVHEKALEIVNQTIMQAAA